MAVWAGAEKRLPGAHPLNGKVQKQLEMLEGWSGQPGLNSVGLVGPDIFLGCPAKPQYRTTVPNHRNDLSLQPTPTTCPDEGLPNTLQPLHGAASRLARPCARLPAGRPVHPSKSGKPMITAKNTFAVKHLHHKPPVPTGLDASLKVVDNLHPPSAIAHHWAAPKKKMSTMSLVL